MNVGDKFMLMYVILRWILLEIKFLKNPDYQLICLILWNNQIQLTVYEVYEVTCEHLLNRKIHI